MTDHEPLIADVEAALAARILSSGLAPNDDAAKKVKYDFLSGIVTALRLTGNEVPPSLCPTLQTKLPYNRIERIKI